MRLNNGLKNSLTVMLKKKRNIPIYSFDAELVCNLCEASRKLMGSTFPRTDNKHYRFLKLLKYITSFC